MPPPVYAPPSAPTTVATASIDVADGAWRAMGGRARGGSCSTAGAATGFTSTEGAEYGGGATMGATAGCPAAAVAPSTYAAVPVPAVAVAAPTPMLAPALFKIICRGGGSDPSADYKLNQVYERLKRRKARSNSDGVLTAARHLNGISSKYSPEFNHAYRNRPVPSGSFDGTVFQADDRRRATGLSAASSSVQWFLVLYFTHDLFPLPK
ncbi:hypothetical protein B0H13DRAFT_2312938 [Mycena leptocephala]|nr:hypothetical protein B0H13DRAFT_2312938 [Mycena leptocephala]